MYLRSYEIIRTDKRVCPVTFSSQQHIRSQSNIVYLSLCVVALGFLMLPVTQVFQIIVDYYRDICDIFISTGTTSRKSVLLLVLLDLHT